MLESEYLCLSAQFVISLSVKTLLNNVGFKLFFTQFREALSNKLEKESGFSSSMLLLRLLLLLY